MRAAARPLSRAGRVAESPELLSAHGKLYAAHVSWELSAERSHATLHVEDLGSAAELELALQHHDPAPRLTAFGDDLLLSYRERPTARARVEQFALRLSPALVARGPATRVGRASGSGAPAVARCGETLFAAAPIEHGSELYVIFHALDPRLGAREPNHQCYATARNFVSASDACSGADLLALVAEETDPSGKPAELLGMRFACAR